VSEVKRLKRHTAFVDALKTVGMPRGWAQHHTCIFWRPPYRQDKCTKVAALNFAALDYRISGKSSSTWSLARPFLPARLQTLSDQGFKVVVFANQCWVGTSALDHPQDVTASLTQHLPQLVDDFHRFLAFVAPVPVYVYIAVARRDVGDPFVMPSRAMWDLMLSHMAQEVDVASSFYVSGPEHRWGSPRDDAQFAEAVGLRVVSFEDFATGRMTAQMKAERASVSSATSVASERMERSAVV